MARGFMAGASLGMVTALGMGVIGSTLTPLPLSSTAPEVALSGPADLAAPELSDLGAPALPSALGPAPAEPVFVLGQTPAPDTLAAIGPALRAREPGPTIFVAGPIAPQMRAGDQIEGTAVLDVTTMASHRLRRTRPEMPLEPSVTATRTLPKGPAAPPSQQVVFASAEILSALRPPVAQPGAALPSAIALAPRARPQPTTVAALSVPTPLTETRLPIAPRLQDAVRDDPAGLILARAIPAPRRTAPEALAAAPLALDGSQIIDVQATQNPQPLPQQEVAPETVETPAIEEPVEAEPAAPPAMSAPVAAAPLPGTRPAIGTPGVSLTERSNNVVIRRSGVAPAAPAPTPTTQPIEAAQTDADAPPIKQFSAPFENPSDKPLMSVVLIDTGGKEIGEGASISELSDFPYQLSFAVDSTLPDAEERMAMYRAEGFEVLSMIDLPSGARPADVETTLAASLSKMNEVVGVLEGTQSGLQTSRAVSDQVAAILAQSGHGLVTQSKGLNTMPNLARKAGVPADPIFRDFDSKDQDERVIRRFLDQAAFRAGQEGAVIMLGRLREETISALLVWGLQDRAGRVTLAPISALLERER
ncbi:MAG: divergent polysaccharide deacetylase family protein [Pseudomonadota bacterium]